MARNGLAKNAHRHIGGGQLKKKYRDGYDDEDENESAFFATDLYIIE